MQEIAIIGLGWLGEPLGRSFLADGFRVKGTTTSTGKKEALKSRGFEVEQLTLEDQIPQIPMDFFRNSDICVLNFPPDKNRPFAAYAAKCLKAAALFTEKTRFVFVSSTGIYPDFPEPISEDTFDGETLAREHPVALAEEALRHFLGDRLTIVRMAGLAGNGRHPAKHLAGKKDLGRANGAVNLIHLEDCVRLIRRIVEKSCWGETFNACAGQHPSREEFYAGSCTKLGLETPSFLPGNTKAAGKIIDNRKSLRLLEFSYLFDNPSDFPV